MCIEDLIQKVRTIEEISEDAKLIDYKYLWNLDRLPSQNPYQPIHRTVYWLVAEAYKAGYNKRAHEEIVWQDLEGHP